MLDASIEQWVAYGQIASAIATVILAFAVLFQIKAAREQVAATNNTVDEMRQSRLEQDRPQVIVDNDHSKSPFVFVVVRNIGRGGAKDISFEFSAPLESRLSVDPNSMIGPVNEQPYFANGLDFLAPGAEISCLWDSMITLSPFLKQRGLQEGIKATSRYKSLLGEPNETEWTLNPLLVAGTVDLVEGKGIKEIAEATEEIADILNTPMSGRYGELQVTTEEERQRRDQLLEDIRSFLKEKLRDQGSGDPRQVRIGRQDIESIGQYPQAAVRLFNMYEGMYWVGEYENFNQAGEWVSFALTDVR